MKTAKIVKSSNPDKIIELRASPTPRLYLEATNIIFFNQIMSLEDIIVYIDPNKASLFLSLFQNPPHLYWPLSYYLEYQIYIS